MNKPYCASCGAPIPSNQGSNSCSMCCGDPYHGKDGHMLRAMEEEAQKKDYERMLEEEYWAEQDRLETEKNYRREEERRYEEQQRED